MINVGYDVRRLHDNKPKVFPSHCEKSDDCYGPPIS